jgi:hypothetical protein
MVGARIAVCTESEVIMPEQKALRLLPLWITCCGIPSGQYRFNLAIAFILERIMELDEKTIVARRLDA